MKSSPFFNELNTNYVPSDIEIMQIQTDLISHTEELARLNTLIHDLCSQRDEIQEYVDSHKALISAPRRLPDDIVREIFVACLPTYRNAVMSRREAPLVLCSISSAWRAIALSMPRLWAALHIPLQFAPANRRRSTVVSEWLQRSGVCPLSLSVVALSPWGQPDDDVTGTMNILAGFADRWQNLELSVTLPFQHQGLESVSAPMLSTMTLRIDVPVMEILSWKLLMGQSLHTLSLRACALDDLAALIPPAWENLIHLCLEDPNHYHGLSSPCVLAILRHCSRLTSIQFQMSESIIETQPGTCIVMPSLESFTILNNVAPLNVLEGLMECLSMPKLNDFGIAGTCGNPTGRPSFLTTLAARSPFIQTLAVDMSGVTLESTLTVLRLLPSLLVIVVWNFSPFIDAGQLLMVLTPDLEAPEATICPGLQTIKFARILHDDSLADEIWQKFLQGRIDSGKGFHRLEMWFERNRPQLMPDIQPFLSRGLEISLNFFYNWSPPPQPTPWTGLGDSRDDFY